MRRCGMLRYLGITVLASSLSAAPVGTRANDRVLLAADSEANAAQRVEVVVEAAGELKFRDKETLKSLPTSVAARLAYDEKRLGDAEDGRAQVIRRYRTVEPTIRVDKSTLQPKLRDERNLLVVRATEAQPQIYSPLGTLNSDELELLQLPFADLLVDRLLPDREVTVNESWSHEEALFCSLLNLDAVSQSNVSSTLAEATEDSARIEFKGLVQGALGGVATEIDVVGRYKFDLQTHRVTWLAVLLKEKRAIGHVEPGIEATTRLQMTLAPIAEPSDLAPAALQELDLSPRPDLLRLEYETTAGGYRLEHDRRWAVMTDSREVLSLRLVDRGELIAQCNIRPITLPDPTRRPTLSQFQADVRRSLDKSFRQFVGVSESENTAGQTVFRAEAIGTVEDLEIHWIYYLVLDAQGRQVVFAFTVEEPLLERFAESDHELIGTVRFIDPAATAEQPNGTSAR